MSNEGATRLLLAGGVVSPVGVVAIALIEGATRPGYSAWRAFDGQLSLSNQGWKQIANRSVGGSLCLAFAVDLWRSLPAIEIITAWSAS